MEEIIFLLFLGLVWIIFATIQDIRSKEIADWLNFSLIIFALGYRFFFSLFSEVSFNFFYQGLFGLAVFFVIGNIFYYGKLFAGGDAKLLMALGPVVALRETFFGNLETLLLFLMIFLLAGAAYTLLASMYIVSKNFRAFKKEARKQFDNHKEIYLWIIAFSAILVSLGIIFESYMAYLGILVFVFPYLHLYSKAVDESAMIKSVSASELQVGDWLYKDIKVGNKTIKARWEGVSKEEILLLQKKSKKRIKIRQGVPFGPVFLVSFLIYLVLIL